MRVTILGSGGSGGVPLITGQWGACNPANPKNRRRRVSVLVEAAGQTILIDTSPDLRAQFLDAEVKRIDSVLYTHDHGDHCHGIDDLRFLTHHGMIPAFATAVTLEALRTRFSYIFLQDGQSDSPYKPLLRPHIVTPGDFFHLGPLRAVAFDQDHGYGRLSTGYRIDNFAYSTDLVRVPEAAKPYLHGLDLWIVDALRWDPHPTHAHVDLALSWILEYKPRRAVLTHLNQQLDYDTLKSYCPAGVEPAYDGLVIDM